MFVDLLQALGQVMGDDNVVHKDDILGVCAIVGFITISWALVEHQLDNCIAMIISDFGGLSKYKKIPRQYVTKSAYLREAFSNKTQFKHFKDAMIALLDRADIAANKRHTMIHGTIDKVEGGTLAMSKLDYDAGLLQKAQMKFDMGPDGGLIPEFATLSADWLNFSHNLFNATRAAKAKEKLDSDSNSLRAKPSNQCKF